MLQEIESGLYIRKAVPEVRSKGDDSQVPPLWWVGHHILNLEIQRRRANGRVKPKRMRFMSRGLSTGRRRVVARGSDDFDLGSVGEYQGLGFRSADGDDVIRPNSVTKRDLRD